jgi:hypothetical protein
VPENFNFRTNLAQHFFRHSFSSFYAAIAGTGLIDLKLNGFNQYVESSTQLHLQYNKAKQ